MVGAVIVRQALQLHQGCRFTGKDVVDGDAERPGVYGPCRRFPLRFLQVGCQKKIAHIGGDAGGIEVTAENERALDGRDRRLDAAQLVAVILIEIGFREMGSGKRERHPVEVDHSHAKAFAADIAQGSDSRVLERSFRQHQKVAGLRAFAAADPVRIGFAETGQYARQCCCFHHVSNVGIQCDDCIGN
ncbi:hypothetical protein ASF29_16715 [Rhizobium sp. Leaf262]|nr:hypothetical protein ASF29_16715 [Rhizobium sp. Leaf262]